MAGKERHMFPGNNTTEGFYSYYQYILGQREADKIICLKGGPGVGKSTFIRKTGNELLDEGYDVDFLHCSSDHDSLDGILVRDKKIAIIDATSPHVVDPINPGAVDTIIHLGDFWDEDGIRKYREDVISGNERLKQTYARVYNYLGAAGKMYGNLADIYEMGTRKEEVYKIAAQIINRELSHREISPKLGDRKKFFASGITPYGCEHYLDTLIGDCRRVYIFNAPVGVSSEKILELFAESAQYRGYDVESYYCAMRPASKVEHVIVPGLSLAMVTSNDYHKVDGSGLAGQVVEIDLTKVLDPSKMEFQEEIRQDSGKRMKELFDRAVDCLNLTKKEHDFLEAQYIPNMDFDKVEALREDVTDMIRAR